MRTTLCVSVLAAAVATAAVLPLPAGAEIFTIDDTVAGSVYDGLLDGFPFPPPGTTPDGNADSSAGSLAVALKSGVTEERGIIELPLAPLEGMAAADIESATLTFNIDDVISTFGPGTTFDGTAAESLVFWAYAGNGAIDLADFGNVAGPPLAVVSTTAHGVITDSSLAASGPLSFEIDVTAALAARVQAGDDFVGFVVATQDDGTATSLDDLGNGGAGPAGTGGAFLPFLTIVTATGEPPVLGKAELRCQKAIGKAGGKYAQAVRGALTKCIDAVLAAVAKDNGVASVADACTAALDVDANESSVSKAAGKARDAIASACGELTPASIGSPCDASAATIAETSACIVAAATRSSEESVAASYASACDTLGAVGLDLDYPVICQGN